MYRRSSRHSGQMLPTFSQAEEVKRLDWSPLFDYLNAHKSGRTIKIKKLVHTKFETFLNFLAFSLPRYFQALASSLQMCIRAILPLHTPCNHYSKPQISFCSAPLRLSKQITSKTLNRSTLCPTCMNEAIYPSHPVHPLRTFSRFRSFNRFNPFSPLSPLTPLVKLFSVRQGNVDLSSNGPQVKDWKDLLALTVFLAGDLPPTVYALNVASKLY
jgi:hypothetical protein